MMEHFNAFSKWLFSLVVALATVALAFFAHHHYCEAGGTYCKQKNLPPTTEPADKNETENPRPDQAAASVSRPEFTSLKNVTDGSIIKICGDRAIKISIGKSGSDAAGFIFASHSDNPANKIFLDQPAEIFGGCTIKPTRISRNTYFYTNLEVSYAH